MRYVVFFLCIFAFFLFPIGGDGDVFHHINTGKYIVEHHALPNLDQYTFTANGRPWISYSWGSSLILYILYTVRGPAGISVFMSFMAVITLLLLALYLRMLGVKERFRILIVALIAPLMAIRWPARPELLTYPLLMLLFITLQLRNKYPRAVLGIPILILLWANCYGSSVILALGIIGVTAGIHVWNIIKHHEHPNGLFLGIAACSFPISLINGYGFQSVLYVLYIPRISRVFTEWGGVVDILNNASPAYILTFQYQLLLYVLYLIFFLSILYFSKTILKKYVLFTLYSLGLIVPFFIVRHIATAALLSAPLLGLGINALRNKQRIILVFPAFLIILFTAISVWTSPRGVDQDANSFPPGVISFLKNNDIDGKAFHNQQIGAFLTYHLYPNIRTFIDTRDDLFIHTPAMDDFMQVFGTYRSVLPLLEKYRPDIVIGDISDGPSYQPLFYSDAWSVVYTERTLFIALPQETAKEKKFPVYDALDPFSYSGLKTGKESEGIRQLQRAYVTDPVSYISGIRLALAYFGLKKYDSVITTLLAIHIPNSPKKPLFLVDIDYLLAQSYFAQEDCMHTKTYLDKTKQDSSGKFIFTPRRTIPSPVYKGYAFYYALCENNLQKARRSLQTFIRDPSVSDSEKTSTTALFTQLMETK